MAPDHGNCPLRLQLMCPSEDVCTWRRAALPLWAARTPGGMAAVTIVRVAIANLLGTRTLGGIAAVS